MIYLGLVLGDIFETTKGDYVVTGISFDTSLNRKGIIVKPYVLKDDNSDGKFVDDEWLKKNYHRIKWKGNIQ